MSVSKDNIAITWANVFQIVVAITRFGNPADVSVNLGSFAIVKTFVFIKSIANKTNSLSMGNVFVAQDLLEKNLTASNNVGNIKL